MSTRFKLTLYWSLIIAVILLVSGLSILLVFSREMWNRLDTALLEETDTTVSALAQAEASQISPILDHLASEKDIGPHRRVRLVVADQVIFDGGDRRGELPDALPQDHGLIGRDSVETGAGPNHYRFATAAFTLKDRRAWLEDGVDGSPIADAIARLSHTLMLAAPLCLLLCGVCGYWLSARALRPLVDISNALSRIGPKQLAARLPSSKIDDENGRLVRTINDLLERLEHASVIQRRFISEAAHELRTPLAVLRSGLEVTLQRPRSNEESRYALEDALREVERLCETAEELLVLARLDAEAPRKTSVINLSEIAAAAADIMSPLAHANSQTISLNLNYASTEVCGNPDELRRLTLNLLSNAIKFTPQGGHVQLLVDTSDSSVRMRISDDGPGLNSEEITRMFDAFYRGRRTQAYGAGLGLTLCREIVRLHRGSIIASNRPTGGCEIEVRFPTTEL